MSGSEYLPFFILRNLFMHVILNLININEVADDIAPHLWQLCRLVMCAHSVAQGGIINTYRLPLYCHWTWAPVLVWSCRGDVPHPALNKRAPDSKEPKQFPQLSETGSPICPRQRNLPHASSRLASPRPALSVSAPGEWNRLGAFRIRERRGQKKKKKKRKTAFCDRVAVTEETSVIVSANG